MKSFQFSEHIARPPHEVFSVISDPRLATGFLENITDSVKLTEGPIGVGTLLELANKTAEQLQKDTP